MLRRDAPVVVDFDTLTIEPDATEVKRLFDFLEFRSLSERLAEALQGTAELIAADDRELLQPEVSDSDSPSESAALLAGLEVVDVAPGWDGSEPGRSPMTGLAVVGDAASAEVVWIPAAHLDHDAVRRALTSAPIRAHDAKALMRALLARDIDVQGLLLDTAIAAYLVDPAQARYALADQIERFTGYTMPADQETTSGQLDFEGADPDDRLLAARDALAVHHLAGPIGDSIAAQGMAELYQRFENPLVRVLAKMEHVGIAVDVDELRTLHQRLGNEVRRLGAELRQLVGRDDLNLNSPIQLRQILYDQHGLNPGKRTKTGYSTDAVTLEKLRDQWPEFIGTAAAVPRAGEAARHLRRGPARRGGRRRAASTPRSTRPSPAPAG